MKLVLVTPEFDPERGGIGRYLSDLYGFLPQDQALALKDSDSVSRWVRAGFGLWRRLRSMPEAVLHVSHVLPLGTVALALRIFTGRRYIVSLHGMDYFLAYSHARKRQLLRLILRMASGITVNSQGLAHYVETFVGKPVFVLPPSLPPASSMALVSRRSDGGVRLLVIARLVERKGIDTVIAGLHRIPHASLTIIGDGPDRLRLERLATESGMFDRITFLGQVSEEEKRRACAEHDVFVMPTRDIGPDREGFGIVYLEAQSFGLPVVAGEGIGVREALHPALKPFAVRHTPETFADAVCRVREVAPRSRDLQAFARSFDARLQSKRFWKWFKHL